LEQLIPIDRFTLAVCDKALQLSFRHLRHFNCVSHWVRSCLTAWALFALVVLFGVGKCATASPSEQLSTAVAQARAAIDKGDLRLALQILDRARLQSPTNSEILYLRGYTLYRLRDLEQARAQLEEVVRLTPPAFRSRYFLGRVALAQGRPADAIVWLQPLGDLDPPIEDSLAQLGKAYLDTNQLSAALDATQKAIKQTPWSGALHYRLGRIYQQLGQPEPAQKEFKASLELKGADREAVEKLIQCSQDISTGKTAEAIEIRDGLLKRPELDPDILIALGTAFANAGLAEAAAEVFDEASRRDPSSFQAHFDLGLAFLKAGHAAAAIEPLEKSLRILPKSPEANTSLGLAYVMNGKFQEALAPLELVHQLEPENLKIDGLLGLTYLRTGSAAKAVPIVQTALHRQQSDPKLWFLMIDCLNGAGQEEAALKVSNEALERFPSLAKSYLAKGQQLARVGRYQDAGPLFEKATELAPSDVDSWLGLAEVQNKSGDYERSLSGYQNVLRIDRDNLTAQLGAARDLVALGKLNDAKETLERAASAHPQSAQVHVELSKVYARLGARELATEQTRISQQLRNAPAQEAGSDR
jgi:tetratricopeptide (TPR) repeat protein